jgi:hypothetical protein
MHEPRETLFDVGEARKKPAPARELPGDWLLLTTAALDAGVSGSTIIKWADSGDLERRRAPMG